VTAAVVSAIESRPVVVDGDAIGQGAAERLREVSVEHELALGKAVKRMQAETVEVVDDELKAATKLLDKAVTVADKATATAEKVAADVHWRGVGRLALAITPAAAILLAIALLVWPVTAALHIGPLLGWSVGQMLDAHGWWLAAWIVVHVAVVGLLGLGIAKAGDWVVRHYRGW
jgi:ribosomal protein L14E/L6E/L27E